MQVTDNPRIYLSVPHMEGPEKGLLDEVFNGNWISTVGPNLDALERTLSERYGINALAVSSGTAAIHLGLRALGVGPGDEVVVQSLTFAATCNPVLYQGASPVFVDSERRTLNLDPNLLDDLLKERARDNRLPKAIVPVDLFGQSADYDAILSVAQDYEIPVIEDAAEAAGATYKGKDCGKFGDIGVFSLNGNKIITCSGGGIVLVADEGIAQKIRHWSTQARDHDPANLGDYYHSEVGYNYRMSNVLAAIAIGQFDVLDKRVAQRRAVAERYAVAFESIPGISVVPESGDGVHTRWLTCCLVTEQEFGCGSAELIRKLREANIDSRPIWKPLHTQNAYAQYESVGGDVSKNLNETGICLPSSSSLTIEDQNRVIEIIRSSSRVAEGHES